MVYSGRHHKQARRLMHLLLGRLQRIIMPPRCIACGNPGGLETTNGPPFLLTDLCNACYSLLPTNLHACRRCALPLSGNQSELICGRCLRRPPPYAASWCAFEYGYPVTHLVRGLKYGGALAASRVLGSLLAESLKAQHHGPWPACFIPVPLHASRYQTRGYNQVIELGRHLEQQLGVRMRCDLVTRVRHTPEQAGLSRRARRRNLRRAFVTTDERLPSHVALLDDVITTGSTMNELARTLKKSGVQRIEVWGLARAAIRLK